ncbi:MAG: hypothetical protein GYA58_02840, partial [Anaerolineaceae bacterium]|nr:hypothetical protein [Anaerolineaceae bacterium]
MTIDVDTGCVYGGRLTALLDQLRAGLEASGFWEAFHTGWVCLDCELMPWSVKAQELLLGQYA